MADNRQYMALEWVIRDIKDTLLQAQQSLESYVRESADVIQLKFCLTYIHQVYGSLHLSGFHGAAMIASEIEALAQGLLDNQVSHKSEATDVLMHAIKQLPIYLEHALKEKQDQPSLVFSLLNDLRAVRGENFLSESTLFSPDLSYAHSMNGARNAIAQDEKQLQLILPKLRDMYRYSAASVMHKNNVDENLSYLLKVSQRLQKLLSGTKRFALWEIVSALVTGLQKNLISETVSIKELLRQLDDEFGQLIDQGTHALDIPTSDELLKNLLYYLTSLTGSTAEIDHVSRSYRLEDAFSVVRSTDYNQAAKPVESSAMRAVAAAIIDEFSDIRACFSQCRTQQNCAEHIDHIYNAFQRVADTLAVLGVGHLRKNMLDNLEIVDTLRENTSGLFAHQMAFPDEQFDHLDNSMSAIEAELESSLLATQLSMDSAGRYFNEEQVLALQESRNGLEEAKDAVVNYIATQWDVRSLQVVPTVLRDVGKRLTVLTLPLPSQILMVCASHIETNLMQSSTPPNWEQLDSLADVIASIDYFLESLSLTQIEDNEILKGAEKGLVALGVPATRVHSIFNPQEDNAQPTHDTESSEQDNVEAVLDAIESASVEADVDQDDELDAEAAAEIIEIFVEEAQEVQETIAEYMPLWDENLKDENALTEIRRAFHTLKGSGRMVKASDVGELSWSIENMLNRILDKTLQPTKVQIALVKKVLLLLPEMVEAFRQQQPTPNEKLCSSYQIWAHQLSKGEEPEDLLEALQEPSENVAIAPAEKFAVLADEQDDEIDVQLWEIFGSESEGHLKAVRDYIVQMEEAKPFYEPPSEIMQRAMHTLKGSAHMAEIVPVAQLMTPMELFVKDLRAYQVNIDDDILQLIKDSVSYTEDALEQMSRLSYPHIQKLDLFLARVEELRERSVGHLIKHEDEETGPKVDPALLEMLMNEGMDILLDIDPLIAQWRESTDVTEEKVAQWQSVIKELLIVQHGAERANLGTMAQLSQAIAGQYEGLVNHQIEQSSDFYDVLLDSHYGLLDIIDAIAGGQDLPEPDEVMLEKLAAFVQAGSGSVDGDEAELIDDSAVAINDTEESPVIDEVAENLGGELEDSRHELVSEGSNEIDQSSEPVQDDQIDNKLPEASIESADYSATDDSMVTDIDEAPSAAEVDEHTDSHLDSSLVDEFIDTAADLVEDLDESVNAWENGQDPQACSVKLQDLLNQFVVAARHAQLDTLAKFASHFNEYLLGLPEASTAEATTQRLHAYQDQLVNYVGALGASAELPELIYPTNEESTEPPTELLESADVLLAVSEESDQESMVTELEPEQGIVDDSSTGEIIEEVTLDLPTEAVTEEVVDNIESSTRLLGGIDELSAVSEENNQPAITPEPEQDAIDEQPAEEAVEEVTVDLQKEVATVEAPAEHDETLTATDENIKASSDLISEETQPTLLKSYPVDEDVDEEIVEIFLEEAFELIEELDETIHDWENGHDAKESIAALQRLLHTFKGGARLAGLMAMGEMAHDFESYLTPLAIGNVPNNAIEDVHQYQDQLINAVNAVQSPDQSVVSDTNNESVIPEANVVETDVAELVEEDVLISENAATHEVTDSVDLAQEADDEASADDAKEVADSQADLENEVEVLLENESLAQDDLPQHQDNNLTAEDTLVEESSTVNHDTPIENISELNNETENNPLSIDVPADEGAPIEDVVQEEALPSADNALAPEVSHDIQESPAVDDDNILSFPTKPVLDVPANEADNSDATDSSEQEDESVETDQADATEDETTVDTALEQAESPPDFGETAPKNSTGTQPASDRLSVVDGDGGVSAMTTELTTVPVATPSVLPSPATTDTNKNNPTASRRAAPQETVKVSADLMEELVNLAGETSISRGRIEEQVSEFGLSLNDMESTVDRLQEQVRRLDIETEAQVLFRQEQLAEQEEFDPLEMDRYSQLQQLSRSLIESVSDLQDLKFTLANRARDTETVLLQQSRINTELQEGLMRSRMVPFSRIVPRLRRIVRQISTELGKEVDFNFEHAEGELDRNMMERIVAPLEHMLRNAVDHGIEDSQTRIKQGKPAVGRINLSLQREGGNVLLHLADDGAGMSVDRIREKAIERQLMNPSAELSEQEILQFIFQAGFSMAETVTQISGRGVGMDVVSSEIKQLGGSIDILSQEGQGTQFAIRLPFTVSVNRALMITSGDNRYAIPLNSIEGIARINPDQLDDYYNNPNSYFRYADNDYKLHYLGNLLDKNTQPKVHHYSFPVPVLLVRSADHSVAIQVDGLQGSREIVVKTLGAQFSSVPGLSGATIMGDGHVVVILDVHAMIRQKYLLASRSIAAPVVEQPKLEPARNPLIMVVDDSVTVRKVTTRFLERQHFDVITAKDGVDAMAVLQDHTPDLMLLDIEMPRMDGFEVAKRVRSNAVVRDLPIIMITSRTGEKHRQTGLAAGANEYMGKPYQEAELLASIHNLLALDSQ